MQIQDTLTNEKRDFAPIDDEVRLYVCGITPYSESHLGHALHAIVFDVVRRYLGWRGFTVNHVQNFTDVDDKLIDRANATGISVEELAQQNSDAYLAQLKRMNVLPATSYPRVSEEIPAIIKAIEGIIANGYAYESNGDVYYRVRKKDDYGKLSKRDVDDLLSGARVEANDQKDDPLDFALWKAAKPGEPQWDSPWGPGRPGWHIECSAMALGALGEQIDIHGGGADLIFPHHENEIAQSEALTGKAPFANFWMHNALLQLGEDKMSKSVGNLVSIDEVLDTWGSDALRMFVINSHYRSPVAYSTDSLQAGRVSADRLRVAAFGEEFEAPKGDPVDPSATRDLFTEAMDDDFNTPRALAALFSLGREINRARAAFRPIANAQATLRELAGVLGLTLDEHTRGSQEAAPFIDLLVNLRTELREAQQWELADRVRDGLTAQGVELNDGPEGTTWSLR